MDWSDMLADYDGMEVTLAYCFSFFLLKFAATNFLFFL